MMHILFCLFLSLFSVVVFADQPSELPLNQKLSVVADEPSSQSYVRVKADVLKVRHAPNGKLLGRIYHGQQFETLERQGEWGKIAYRFNQYGWVHFDYVEPVVLSVKNHVAVKDFCQQVNRKFKLLSWKDINCKEKEWEIGGHSVNGLPLIYAELSPKNVEQDLSAPTTILVCSVHSDESTAYQCFKLKKLLDQKPSLLANKLVLVPLANPDGFIKDFPSRTNANQVDLNRNLPTSDWHQQAHKLWHKKNKRQRYFPGKNANTEPENQFLVMLMQRYRPDKVLSIHAPLDFIDLDYMDTKTQDQNVVSVHNKAKSLAIELAEVSRAKFRDYRTYPGSLGRYGDEWKIPIYTLELPSARPEEVQSMFSRFEQSLLMTFEVILGSSSAYVARAEL